MFFMMGIMPGRKDLNFTQMIICPCCGKYGRYMVYMTYTVLSLFFIPCFKWNKEYYVQTSCCGMTYHLDPEIGKRIERGEQLEITPRDIDPVSGSGYGSRREKRCGNCGYTTTEEFEFCPKCGRHF